MSEQAWTPNQIALRLSKLSRELDTKAEELTRQETDAVAKRHVYELAFARAFLEGLDGEGAGSVDSRKQNAVLRTGEEKLAAETADAVLRAAHVRIRTLKVQIETGRSLGALMRAEMGLGGVTP